MDPLHRLQERDDDAEDESIGHLLPPRRYYAIGFPMLLTNSLPSQTFDCYVIGTGPAGITLALELARANKTVLLFESGTATDARSDMLNAVNHGHFPDGWWDRHSVRALGGTSRVWSGFCVTLTELDFNNPAVGLRWPMTRATLVPYYRRAAAILDRDPAIVDVETPLVPGFVYRPFSVGRPTRFGRKYREVLEHSATIHVALGVSVVGLDANASRSAVTGLTCFHHASGLSQPLAIEPTQVVVLAGGGVGNAQLLLQPRSDGTAPIGNESGQVGKFLMEHPHFHGTAEIVLDEDLDRQPRPVDFGLAHHALVPDAQQVTRYGLLACSIDCQAKTTDHPMADYLFREYGRRFYFYRSTVRSEMLPSASNRVFLTGERNAAGMYRPRVRCVIGAEDFLSVERTLQLLGESLIESRKGRVRILNRRLYRDPIGGGHIMGTTRMGTNRSDSVVDQDCRVHGYHNLFVAGSSVFPTGGYANPTLTIVALSLRLAETLAGRR